MSEPSVSPPEPTWRAWCPSCGREIESGNLTVDDHGWCSEHGLVAVESSAPIVGFAVMAATGECYALRSTQEAAEKAEKDADEYLDGALDCGHPAAGPWVRARYPFTIIPVTYEEREDILADGTPTLDREPID